MTLSIRINASSVGSLLGCNPYQSISEGLLGVWKSSDKKSYEDAHRREGVLTDSERRRQTIKAFPTLMSNAATCARPDDFIRKVRGTSSFSGMAFLPEEGEITITRKEAQAEAIRMASTSHGERREDEVLRCINGMHLFGGAFVKTDQLLSRSLGPDITLQGRVDGWSVSEDGHVSNILEIKTRVHTLFRKVRPYEKVQCLAYLGLLPTATSCVLVEALFKQTGRAPDLNVNTIPRDDDAWREMVAALVHRAAVLRHIVGHPEREAVLLRTPKTLDDLCTQTGWPEQN